VKTVLQFRSSYLKGNIWRRGMRKKLSLSGLFTLLVLLVPLVVSAQSQVTLPAVEVDLWPEYDDPGVLVIYRLTLPSTVSLPAQVNLRIPATAGPPNAVAVRQPDGSLMNANYTQQPQGTWNQLSITAASPEVQVEYYDPSIQKDGQKRQYTYQWPGDHEVQALTIQVQQPWDAKGLQISPNDFGNGQQAGDGLLYYTENIGSVPAGPPFEIQIGYEKPSDTLSVTKVQQANPVNAQPITATSPVSFNQYLPWLLAFLGAALIVGGGIWFILNRRQTSTTKAQQRARHKPASTKVGTMPAEEGYIYCHQCGRRAAPGDRYCRDCGAELRH
jgi:hypothetical protein